VPPHYHRAVAENTNGFCVGFDAGPLLDPPTGVARYTRELGNALEARGLELRRYAVVLRGHAPAQVARLRAPARLVRSMWRRFGRPRIERLIGDVDVVHATNFVLPPVSAPGVVTVHDLSFYRDDTWPGGKRLRDLVPWSVSRAALVLTPTQAVAAEVRERYRIPDRMVKVTGEGVSQVFFGTTPLGDAALARLGINGPFVVAAGSLEPRKNLSRLLQAWSHLADDLEGWTLVLAGPKGWGPQLPKTPGVLLPGYLGDETLPGLFAAAEIFCYPSLYEGFGLPPLEAMAAGTPVVAGDYSCAEEVLQDAALRVEPTDIDAIASALSSLASDTALRRRLALKGRARASSFSWERTAAATEKAYLAASS
jgi:glycosyltransferase involved in cell wall biosynthesis